MPQLVTVRVERPDGRPFRLWIPVLPVLLVLFPLVIVLVLAAFVACLVFRVDVPHAFGTAWRIAFALPGTLIDIDQGGTGVRVAIR
ncbi:hypothetical protein [Dactylosporangium sp. NPDC005555]|uniref:hypothetical protein n=1 Tax=Dactylosporangium sp. NPDC005555 TaxID=3154889 RepID=UPI0033B33947